ncbi:tRNA (cytosine(38)-C(5))-methyltransferase-like isoform X1 [Takifugu rubripes]|uniref:tRNA (cytosine(38)-C(5))-methyltransferase-like isoform X1 n=1 Tax=Takifugu rubripes TaxID=31033 RepID=UPI0011459292|nr:tRNA (cytosine(38)-C(5))-methyltransferase-like isoform X1 [Takifugu rubripes]
MRVLELYSGIGGMHYALIESNLSYQVVAAVDINTTANQVYTHNFPNTALLNKTIEGITLEEFNKLSFDMILMSPPCQPFTRIGLQRDLDDPRTKSFLHIVDLLPRLSKAPLYILLENVKGFEKSAAREYLVKTLRECQYTVQEMMVSPTHVGIPNSRLRYYLMAKRSAQQKSDAQTGQEAPVSFHPTFQNLSPTTDELQELQISAPSTGPAEDAPPAPHICPSQDKSHTCPCSTQLKATLEVQKKQIQNSDLSVQQIQAFLEPQEDVHEPQHLLPPKTLLRYAQLLDIVRPSCRRSVCFTKGYRKYVEGTGSVLQCCLDTSVEDVFPSLDQCSEEEKVQRLLDLKLRYFTPREVANLMGFPQSFTFPESVSTKQQYRLLGNSLNVVVVAKLLQLLVTPELQHKDGRPH